MKTIGIILGVIAFFAVIYLIFRNAYPASSSYNASRVGGDGVVGEADVDGEIVPASSFKCTVHDVYGNALTITSRTNSLWFQQVCSGLQPYNYQRTYYYAPIYWRRRRWWWMPNGHGGNGTGTGTGVGTGTGT